MTPPPIIHGSVAALDGKGLLIRGPSGCGKSSLLAALIAGAPPARLVADDRVVVQVERGRVVAAPPVALAGLLEVRGAGLIRLPHVPRVSLTLVVDIAPEADCPRLPDADQARAVIAGIAIRRMWVPAGVPDAAARVRIVLADLSQAIDE